jgi:MscS family membrane protein
MRIVSVILWGWNDHILREGRRGIGSVLPLTERVLKAGLALLATIFILQNLGFNVTGIVAGLGVGGLAVALAAQKTVENLFGGVSVVVDQPVRIGDMCKFGDKQGVVEEIGLRSTRIRTLDMSVVTVPNAEFSQVQIENLSTRSRIRLYTLIGLRYETTPDQLRYVLAEIRKLMLAHPKVDPEPLRVRFCAFGASSLDVEIFAMVRTADMNEFGAIREDLFLRILDIIGASGTGIAFPSRTLYLGKDPGLHAERSAEAERIVAGWRDSGALPFPDLPPSRAAEIEDTLDYPPKGSGSGPKSS